MRANSLNSNYNKDNLILEATSKYFLNDEFKSKYDYDVFFSVDTIDIEKAKEYFGEDRLINVHITETDWTLQPIDNKLLNDYNYYHNEYLKIDFENCEKHINALYQYYRMYSAYNLLKNHQKKTNITYDYLVRIRPDIRLMQDIIPLFNILETTNKEIIAEHEQLIILKYELRDIFKLIKYYGTFKNCQNNRDIFRHFIKQESDMLSEQICRFCPEKQFIEYLNYIFINKKLIFKEVFTGITYPSYNLLYRGNGIYGYSDYNNHKNDWTPYNNLEYIKKL